MAQFKCLIYLRPELNNQVGAAFGTSQKLVLGRDTVRIVYSGSRGRDVTSLRPASGI